MWLGNYQRTSIDRTCCRGQGHLRRRTQTLGGRTSGPAFQAGPLAPLDCLHLHAKQVSCTRQCKLLLPPSLLGEPVHPVRVARNMSKNKFSALTFMILASYSQKRLYDESVNFPRPGVVIDVAIEDEIMPSNHPTWTVFESLSRRMAKMGWRHGWKILPFCPHITVRRA